MKYHIVLNTSTAKRLDRENLTPGKLPKSDLNCLATNLKASFAYQKACEIKTIDRIRARIWGKAENWAYARFLASQLGENDVVFCPSEDIGIPLTSICRDRSRRPKIVVWFHRIAGLRTKVALKLLQVADAVDLSLVSSRSNQDLLHRYLGLDRDRILFWRHPIDVDYFDSRSRTSVRKNRPTIASIGLEYRDYQLLAAATANLNLDVRVAGFSQFQSQMAKMPQIMPDNMTNKKYLWLELLELYRDADLIVIPLQDNVAAAGITVLLEAMACKKPIVCTRTQGLAVYLTDKESAIAVEPGNTVDLQRAITYLLEHPEEAKRRGERAYEIARTQHDLPQQIEVLGEFIRTLATPSG